MYKDLYISRFYFPKYVLFTIHSPNVNKDVIYFIAFFLHSHIEFVVDYLWHVFIQELEIIVTVTFFSKDE